MSYKIEGDFNILVFFFVWFTFKGISYVKLKAISNSGPIYFQGISYIKLKPTSNFKLRERISVTFQPRTQISPLRVLL